MSDLFVGAINDVTSGGSLILPKPKMSSRLDKELNQMTNLLIHMLGKYEADYGPRLEYAKKIAKELGLKGKGLEVRNKLHAILKDKDMDGDISEGNYTGLKRALGSLLATDPGLYPDILEAALSTNDPNEARKIISAEQVSLTKLGGKEKVGHHVQGLGTLRPVLQALQSIDDGKTRVETLRILEDQYGLDFGELSLIFLNPLAHTPGDLGLTGKGMRRDMKAKLSEAFGKDITSLNQINENLGNLILPAQAHALQYGGTHGFPVPVDAIKGLTKPRDIAKALSTYLYTAQASGEQGQNTSNIIDKYGYNEDGSINTEAWLPGGALETALRDQPVIGVVSKDKLARRDPFAKGDIFGRNKDLFKGPEMTQVVGTEVPQAQPTYTESGQESGAAAVYAQENAPIDFLRDDVAQPLLDASLEAFSQVNPKAQAVNLTKKGYEIYRDIKEKKPLSVLSKAAGLRFYTNEAYHSVDWSKQKLLDISPDSVYPHIEFN